jgi:hypothetical protein
MTFGLQGLFRSLVVIVLFSGLAELSFRFIELPSAHFRKLFIGRPIIVICLGLSISLLGFLTTQAIYENQQKISLSATKDSDVWTTNAKPAPEARLGIFHKKRLFVVGDSHAGAYGVLFQKLRDSDDLDVTVLMQPGCPFLNFNTPANGLSSECAAFVMESIAVMQREAVAGDVLFLPGLQVPRLPQPWDSFEEEDLLRNFFSSEAESTRDLALQDVRNLLSSFAEIPIQIILEAPKPVFRISQHLCGDWFNRINPRCKSGASIERGFIEHFRDPILRRMQIVDSELESLSIWDPLQTLCSKKQCLGMNGSTPIFSDADHLAAAGNRKLYPDFHHFLLREFDLADSTPARSS